MAKVLIFNGYGNEIHTKEMEKIMLPLGYPRGRINEICNYIEKVAIKCDLNVYSEWEEFVELLKNNPENIYYFADFDETQYFIYDSEFGHHCKFKIVDVDTSRPWEIQEYDGAEYIQYLDYNVIDKEFNYCKLKEKVD